LGVSDYLEQLDAAALELLAETTGVVAPADAHRFFRERPNDIVMALMSPEAADLLHPFRAYSDVARHRMLHIAIAVHRSAEDICKSGWTAGDSSPVDLPLLRFCGQRPFQRFMVDLFFMFPILY